MKDRFEQSVADKHGLENLRKVHTSQVVFQICADPRLSAAGLILLFLCLVNSIERCLGGASKVIKAPRLHRVGVRLPSRRGRVPGRPLSSSWLYNNTNPRDEFRANSARVS